MSELQSIARSLVAPQKGILAADESTGTIGKRFDKIGVENTEEHRRAYRELLFTTPSIGRYISGVILFDETLRQRANDGHTFVAVLEKQHILSGIKVDQGLEEWNGSAVEKVTKGLEGLAERLQEYARMDVTFAKWRAVYNISESTPSAGCIEENARRLARYAKLCQDANIVPIVEPEVLMDAENSTHSIERCADVTAAVLKQVFKALAGEGVQLSGMLLKPNMVIQGKDFGSKASPEQVADMTLKCLKATVPPEVPGIVFLSGGQSDEEACENLNAIHSRGEAFPWELSFSYGRGLQSATLKAWMGKAENVSMAQQAFLRSAMQTSAARMGMYTPAVE